MGQLVSRPLGQSLLFLIVFLAFLGVSLGAAHASSVMVGGNSVNTNFTCKNGIATGELLQVSTCPDGPQDGKIISFFVCQFEQLLNEVLSKVYCAVVGDATPVVMAALTLFITIVGVTFLMGLLPFTAKELAIIGVKFTMVLAFATQAEYMIQIGYTLFVSMSKEGIVMVFNHLMVHASLGEDLGVTHLANVDDVYRLFDRTLENILNLAAQGERPENQCQNAIFTMMLVAAAVIPPLAAMGMFFMVKLLWMVLRAVFGYCQGLLGLTFLVVLSPIYISFALFKPTRTLFDKWIKHLVSFAFQMVIVFAFLGMVFYILSKMTDDANSYLDLVKPYQQDAMATPGVLNFINTCGICELAPAVPNQPPSCAPGGRVLPLSEMQRNEQLLEFMTVKVLALVLIFYILEMMISFVPEMAKILAGSKYSGQLGGGRSNSTSSPSNMELPFEAGISNTLSRAGAAYARSNNAGEGAINALRATFVDGILADRGLVDGMIRGIANPNEPFRNPDEFDNSPASVVFGAAAALTGGAAAFRAIAGGLQGGNAALVATLATAINGLPANATPDQIDDVIRRHGSNVPPQELRAALGTVLSGLQGQRRAALAQAMQGI